MPVLLPALTGMLARLKSEADAAEDRAEGLEHKAAQVASSLVEARRIAVAAREQAVTMRMSYRELRAETERASQKAEEEI